MKRHLIFILLCLTSFEIFAQQIIYQTDPKTHAITHLSQKDAHQNMNWVIEPSGKQYASITDKYGWGLGFLTIEKRGKESQHEWQQPSKIEDGKIFYQAGDIQIQVTRAIKGQDLVENYHFVNLSDKEITLKDINIYTPFNDNYPDAPTCLKSRTNAHIWEGGSAAYVNAMHMSGCGPHLGLVVTQGEIEGYEISGRALEWQSSNMRGVISLSPESHTLQPQKSYDISWCIFSHDGEEDFYKQLLLRGSAYVTADKYVSEQGEKIRFKFHATSSVMKVHAQCAGKKIRCHKKGQYWEAIFPCKELGENRITFTYDQKQTHAVCLVVSKKENLLSQRAKFIVENQQMKDHDDKRFGAYMVYDCEEHKIFLNDRNTVSFFDRDEGGERLGMGVFLAKQYLRTKDEQIKESLIAYAKFIREGLQNEDYQTWSVVTKDGRNRCYNYPLVATFYFYMYQLTQDKQYALDGYYTLKSMYQQFGHGFYAIQLPINLSLKSLKQADLNEEVEQLKSDYLKNGAVFLKNSIHYPKHEVNYEQSIVTPAIITLSQLYLQTHDEKYLEEVKRQMPLLESFCGKQASFHLNNIAIRHWDGYWFGKREMWGDTFPHYWSCLTAEAYYYYALCTKDKTYLERAKQIVDNNLCLFTEQGKASCAYIYPKRVNHSDGRFYDPFANDQDWALVSYLLVHKDL